MRGKRRNSRKTSDNTRNERCVGFRKRIQSGEDLVQLRDECFVVIAGDGVFTDRKLFGIQGDILFKLGDVPTAGVFYLLSGGEGKDAETAIRSAISTFGPNLDFHLKAAIPSEEFEYFEEEVQNRLKDAMRQAGVQDVKTLFQSGRSWWRDRSELVGCALMAIVLYLLICAGVAFFLRLFD